MSTFRNQAASAVLSVATVVSLMGGLAPVAYGQSTADLQAQINSLLATIAALQSQIAGQSAGSASSFTFTRDLTVGSTGDDVMALQRFLNANGAMVAGGSGAGSPGRETSYFGGLTKAAVAQWQGAHGITPAVGYFGPKTRAAVNATGAVVVPPVGSNFPAGCTSAAGYSPTTGLPCSTVVGPTPTSILGCNATGEGSMVISLAASPAANPNAYAGIQVPVYGIDVTAVNSDITVDRVNLRLQVTNGSTTYKPSSFITNITAWDGTNRLVSVPVNDSTINTDSSYNYSVSVGGINFKVLKGVKKTLTFSIDTIGQIDNNRTVTIFENDSNAMRAHDCGNLSIYDGSLTTSFSRAHTFKSGGASTLTLSTASDNPSVARNIYLDGSSGATDVELLRFVANAQTADATLLTLDVSSSNTSVEPSVYKLYDSAGTLLASASSTAHAFAFTQINSSVTANTYKTFVIKGDFPATGNGMLASVAIPTTVSSGLFRKADGTTAAPTISSAIKSSGVYAYREAAILTFVSGAATKNVATYTSTGGSITSSSVDGTLTFKVMAKGGTLTLPTGAMFTIDVVSGTAATIATIASASISAQVDKTTNIADGDTATITLSARQLASAAGISGSGGENLHYVLSRFLWTVGGTTTDQTYGLTLFKTPDTFLP